MKKLFLSLVILFATLSSRAETVTIVAEDDWYPYCADKGGKPEGMAVDVVRQAFKTAGVDVVFKVMPYAKCIEDTKKGLEVACFDTSWTEKYYADFYQPKHPLFEAEIAIYAASTYNGKTDLKVPDLEGKMVGITNGYEYGNEFSANKKIKTDTAATDLQGLKKLIANRTDYFLIYTKVADYLMKENKELQGKVKRVGLVTVDKIYLTFSKTHKDGKKYSEVFDSGMEKLNANGGLKKIYDDWNNKLK